MRGGNSPARAAIPRIAAFFFECFVPHFCNYLIGGYMYSNNKSCVVRVRVTEEQLEKLISLSKENGVSVSELIRQLLDKL